jgi:hypothetical protein
MQLSEIGKLAAQFWYEIPNHFSMVELGNFVVMPNHVHGILIIDKKNDEPFVETRQCLVSNIETNSIIGSSRFQNQGKNTISSIVGSYKSIVTKMSRQINPNFMIISFAIRNHLITFNIILNKIHQNGKKIHFINYETNHQNLPNNKIHRDE